MSEMEQTDRINQLVSALRDENEALRDHAAATLGQMGLEALPQLMSLLADEDVVIRSDDQCDRAHGTCVVEPMIEALREDEWSVREQAAPAFREAEGSARSRAAGTSAQRS